MSLSSKDLHRLQGILATDPSNASPWTVVNVPEAGLEVYSQPFPEGRRMIVLSQNETPQTQQQRGGSVVTTNEGVTIVLSAPLYKVYPKESTVSARVTLPLQGERTFSIFSNYDCSTGEWKGLSVIENKSAVIDTALTEQERRDLNEPIFGKLLGYMSREDRQTRQQYKTLAEKKVASDAKKQDVSESDLTLLKQFSPLILEGYLLTVLNHGDPHAEVTQQQRKTVQKLMQLADSFGFSNSIAAYLLLNPQREYILNLLRNPDTLIQIGVKLWGGESVNENVSQASAWALLAKAFQNDASHAFHITTPALEIISSFLGNKNSILFQKGPKGLEYTAQTKLMMNTTRRDPLKKTTGTVGEDGLQFDLSGIPVSFSKLENGGFEVTIRGVDRTKTITFPASVNPSKIAKWIGMEHAMSPEEVISAAGISLQ